MVHHSKFLYSALVVSAMAVGANAQVTTSAISGKVLDETKAPVIGATVVAIHEPSGTLYGAVTNVDGRYTIQGMRTGGPYKIEISYVGYNKTAFTGISLELGNTLSLNAEMKPSSELLDEVVVVADAKANAGAAHNFSTQKIENTPTVDRNVYDIVKNMPMASTYKSGGISFAGSNNRYNSFQIDGTVSNDVFGLSASGTNGGQTGANPISMDAIQEIQVVLLLSTYVRVDLPEAVSMLLQNKVPISFKLPPTLISQMKICMESIMPHAITKNKNWQNKTPVLLEGPLVEH